MAILKKGSKGKDVQKLQADLNKRKSKPNLKVDGDFGANTEASVKHWQKLCKLKADGQVGPLTQAALIFGGPLPKMDVPDQARFLKILKLVRMNNAQAIGDYAVLASLTLQLSSAMDKLAPQAVNAVQNNQVHYDAIVSNSEKMVKLQSDFQKILLKDPGKAKRLADDCAKLHDANQTIGKSKIGPNFKKMNVALSKMRARLEKDTGTIKKILDGALKRADDIEKKMNQV